MDKVKENETVFDLLRLLSDPIMRESLSKSYSRSI